jgi:hypothetical protein
MMVLCSHVLRATRRSSSTRDNQDAGGTGDPNRAVDLRCSSRNSSEQRSGLRLAEDALAFQNAAAQMVGLVVEVEVGGLTRSYLAEVGHAKHLGGVA